MKAGRTHGPGEVRLDQIPEPGSPGPGEVVLRMLLVGLCGTDGSQYRTATMIPCAHPHPVSGKQAPLILGHEGLGTVVAVGEGVTTFHIGQRVVPGCAWWCGECPQCQAGRISICEQTFLYGIHADGCMAQFATFPAKMCVPVPDGCSDLAAVLAQPCAVALHALSRSGITSAHTVALFGAGSIGRLLLAVMQTKHITPRRLIVVDRDPEALQHARSLGATSLICSGEVDPVSTILELTDGQRVEICIEATGNPQAMTAALDTLGRSGRLLLVGISAERVAVSLDWLTLWEQELIGTNGQHTLRDLPDALNLLATTDLAERIPCRIIGLDALVEEGLKPLSRHQLAEKIIVRLPGGKGRQ